MRLIKTRLNNLDFWYKGDDKFVGQRVALGKYEEYETKLLLRQINQDSVVVDVGANIGYYTLLFAQKCKKVYAIEPDKDSFEILKKNVEENKLKNVVLVNGAASDRTERRYLIKDKNNYGNSHLNPSKSPFDKGDLQHTNCLRLDDILANEQKVDLIKIDTQGWEPAVIEGAKKIIKRDSPTLFLEYWPEGCRQTSQDLKKMMDFLKSIYQNIWQIDPDLNIYKKIKEKIIVDKETGYVDLWMNNKKEKFSERFKYIKLKKLVKKIIGVK